MKNQFNNQSVQQSELKENERYFIKIGNCYADFLGAFHELRTRADHNKAHPFTQKREAVEYCRKYCSACHTEIVIRTYNPPKKEEKNEEKEEV